MENEIIFILRTKRTQVTQKNTKAGSETTRETPQKHLLIKQEIIEVSSESHRYELMTSSTDTFT